METILSTISSTQVYVPDVQTLQDEGGIFVRTLKPASNHATLVTLIGELGAGKTSFTQGVAHALGVNETVTSPTFVLQKNYELHDQEFSRLIHIDAYRLEGERSLEPLRFAELYQNKDTLIVLEWPERVASQLPPPDHTVSLSVSGEGRELSYA